MGRWRLEFQACLAETWCTGGEAPVRLELGKASQTRIRATTFPKAAHMCQVKRGFGSWQHCPEPGMDLGKAPAETLQGSREGGKVLAEIPSPFVFQRGCSYLSVLSWPKKVITGDIFRAKDTAVRAPSRHRETCGLPGKRWRPMSTEDMEGSGCCSATLMNSLQVRTGMLKILKGFPLPWAGDAGVAEDGGVAWPVPSAFLPAWGTEL